MTLNFERESDDYFGNTPFVKELTAKDFDPISTWKLKDGKCGIILFYAPWCPHCKAIREVWEQLGEIATYFNVYAVNCEKQKRHVAKIKSDREHLITGFPSIVIYKRGDPIETYRGERVVGDLIKTTMSACKGI